MALARIAPARFIDEAPVLLTSLQAVSVPCISAINIRNVIVASIITSSGIPSAFFRIGLPCLNI